MTTPITPLDSLNTLVTRVLPVEINQCPVPDNARESLLLMPDLHALGGYLGSQVAAGITCYSLFTPDSGQPWTLDVYDCSSPHTPLQSDKAKTLTILEGKAKVRLSDKEIAVLPGYSLCLPPLASYALTPFERGCRYLSLSMAEEPKPEDSVVRPLHGSCYKSIFEQGENSAYELIDGQSVNGRFNVVILDVLASTWHYHLKMASTLVALGGEVALALESNCQTAKPGKLLQIPIKIVHQIRSATATQARMLCINFPALDTTDIYNL